MKSAFLAMVLVISYGAVVARAQNSTNTGESVDDLKLQLIDLNAQEEAAKLRAEQLDEALKPENIEHSLAGFGSTRPEELREQRRRQLTIEKTAVTAVLEQLAVKRSQLETAISTAETQAYQESARGNLPIENFFGLGMVRSGKWLAISLVAITVSGLIFAGLVLLKKLS